MREYRFIVVSLFFLFSILIISCNRDNPDDDKNKIASTLYLETDGKIQCDGSTETYTQVQVVDRGQGTGTMTWTNDKTYLLDGFVFVNSGQVLTIEPGTVIKATPSSGNKTGALIVARGAKVIANGTAESPIIFTSVEDKIYSNRGVNCNNSAFTETTKGLWGGVILLGNAPVAKPTKEGVLPELSITEERAVYGGSDAQDNSGILRYVSIRHCGKELVSANSFAGLTMAGVGRGTTIDHIEVYASQDDGFKWYGGTVNTSHLLAAFCEDDAMSYAEGWQGYNQFWLAYQGKIADKANENSGGDSNCRDCKPYSMPTIVNATFAGNGSNTAISFRNNAAGKYYNSVFLNYLNGIEIEYDGSPDDSYHQFAVGNIKLEHSIFSDIEQNHFVLINSGSGDITDLQASLDNYFNDNNYVGDAQLENLVPTVGGITDQPGETLSEEFLQKVEYKGAFKAGEEPWSLGWTKFAQRH